MTKPEVIAVVWMEFFGPVDLRFNHAEDAVAKAIELRARGRLDAVAVKIPEGTDDIIYLEGEPA
jgi:hypothetical protein